VDCEVNARENHIYLYMNQDYKCNCCWHEVGLLYKYSVIVPINLAVSIGFGYWYICISKVNICSILVNLHCHVCDTCSCNDVNVRKPKRIINLSFNV